MMLFRFTTLFALFMTALPALSMPTNSQNTLQRRATIVCATVTTLTNVPVVSTLSLGAGICLCADAGLSPPQLTVSSATALNAQLQSGGLLTTLNTILSVIGGTLPQLLATLDAQAALQVANSGSTATSCVSNQPVRRSLSKTCPLGFSACALDPSSFTSAFECIDIFNNIESCGGCPAAYGGKNAGVDCSAIPGVDLVQCLAGFCKINSCAKGFQLAQNGTACVPLARRSVYSQ